MDRSEGNFSAAEDPFDNHGVGASPQRPGAWGWTERSCGCHRRFGTPVPRLPVALRCATLRRVSDVTRILDRVQQGDPKAAQELLPLVYEELRRLATARMAHESPGQTLQPTALVHEAWLRLAGSEKQSWRDRRHFFAA